MIQDHSLHALLNVQCQGYRSQIGNIKRNIGFLRNRSISQAGILASGLNCLWNSSVSKMMAWLASSEPSCLRKDRIYHVREKNQNHQSWKKTGISSFHPRTTNQPLLVNYTGIDPCSLAVDHVNVSLHFHLPCAIIAFNSRWASLFLSLFPL